jgi:hypothetical protein
VASIGVKIPFDPKPLYVIYPRIARTSGNYDRYRLFIQVQIMVL